MDRKENAERVGKFEKHSGEIDTYTKATII